MKITKSQLMKLIMESKIETEDERINRELKRYNKDVANKMQLNLYYYRLNNSEDISKLVELYNDVDNNFDIDEDVQEKLLDSIYDKYVSLGGDTSED